MHNAYFSSTLLSLKTKGSLSFSFNDYSSLLNERFDRNPVSSSGSSCSCSCCCCCQCAFTSHNRVPISPGFLYGLRQSTLIQCSPSRRLILGGGDRYFYRVPFYDLNGGVYEVSCSTKGRNDRTSFNGTKGRFRRMVSEERNERYRLGGVDDAEAVISLLSEEVSQEYLGGRERNEWLAKRVEVKKREDRGSEFYRGKKNKVEVEKRRNYGGESSGGRKRNGESNFLESESKYGFESAKVEVREEGFRRNEEREDRMRGEEHRGRNRSSSCSSYYSFSSPGEYGSDEEVKDKKGHLMEGSLSESRKDTNRNEQDAFKAQVVEEFNRNINDVEGHDEGRYTASGSRVEWDCRKKSEKKLSEVSVEEKQSKKESSEIHLRMDKTHETDHGKASSSHKQFDGLDEKSSVVVSLDKGTRKPYNQTDNQDKRKSELGSKRQEVIEIEKIHGSDVETTSQVQKRIRGREENSRRSELRTNSKQFTKTSEDLDVDTEKISDSRRQSESRMNTRKGDKTWVQSSAQGRKEQYEQESERISGPINLRKKPESFSEISETHDTNSKTSIIQTETIMKNQEEKSRLASVSHIEKKDKHTWTDNEYQQSTESRNGSQNITSVTVVHASDMKTYIESQKTSEGIISQEHFITSEVKPTGKTRERWDQTDGTEQTKSRKEVQKATGLSSSHEKSSGEGSSLVASLNLVSQSRVQQIDMEEEERNSQVMLTPPSSQLVARGSLHVDLSVDIASQEVSGKSSDSGSISLYTQSEAGTSTMHNESYVRGRQGETQPLNMTTHEDALGSAHRLEESSMQFVGEFMEKARHEASTSEFQKEKNVSLLKEVSEGEKQWIKDSGQYGSEDFQLQVHESRGSSERSGGKGPSDEMWHVTDPSVQPPEAETPEGNEAAANAIVKRRGRTWWNIMADIVRLRWGSHTETPNSAAKSDIKSSSNESFSSEAWFSVRESDKNSDENVKRERRSIPQEVTASQQLQLGKTFTQTQGEASDTLGAKNKARQLEADMTSSSSITGAGSTSKVVSSTFQVSPPDMEVVPSPLSSPARSTRRSPVVEEISETGKINESRTGSMAWLGQPFSSKLTEISGFPPKDGELKQRKLQRKKQVLKDRFEEWEEAYKLENEQRKIDEMFMREALLEAKKAADTWEVPVGAVLVQNGKIIARGCNLVEELRDSTAHAEMICIREASNVLRTWRLADTTLYVTLEPCPMCAGAILQARISTLVWGAPNKLLGADGSWVRLLPSGGEEGDGSEPSDRPDAPVHPFHPKMTIRRGVLASECADVMQQFFQLRRRKKEKNAEPPPPPSCLPITNHPSKLLGKMQHMFHIMFCL